MIFILPTYALLTVFDSYWISKAVMLGFGRYNSTLVDAFFFKKKTFFSLAIFCVIKLLFRPIHEHLLSHKTFVI